MCSKIPYPTIESEEEYLEEVYRAAVHMNQRHGKPVEFYYSLLTNDPWPEYYEILEKALKH